MAVVIARVSTPQQNLENQKSELIEFCSTRNLHVTEIIEIKESAYNNVPKQMRYFLDNLDDTDPEDEEPDVTHVVFQDVDRMSRNTINGIKIIEKLKNAGITVLFARDSCIDCNTPDGMNMIRYKLSCAELESDRLGQRIRNALFFSPNRHLCRPVPYGQKRTGNKYVNYPQEQFIIQLIIKMKKYNTIVFEVLQHIYDYHVNFDKYHLEKQYAIYARNNEPMCATKQVRCTYSDIANILNGYNITKRGTLWTLCKVMTICKKNKCENIHEIHLTKQKRVPLLCDMDTDDDDSSNGSYDSDDSDNSDNNTNNNNRKRQKINRETTRITRSKNKVITDSSGFSVRKRM
jgi:DNA invertase Pin-like site-specific DNA recombinase